MKIIISSFISELACRFLARIGVWMYHRLPKTWYVVDDDNHWHNVPCIKIEGHVFALVLRWDDDALMCAYRRARVIAIGAALFVFYRFGLIDIAVFHEAAHIIKGPSGTNNRLAEIRADLLAVKYMRRSGKSKEEIRKAIKRTSRIVNFLIGEWAIDRDSLEETEGHPQDKVREWYQNRYLERLK